MTLMQYIGMSFEMAFYLGAGVVAALVALAVVWIVVGVLGLIFWGVLYGGGYLLDRAWRAIGR